ncbi:hypothetical protein GNI_066490 [Gregarina niphandrodes]|uniref:VASt domain-containing protein n=1 Tax=Gregarina niphandrodes TaxID=110365 RepID=A0A023B7T8_GRENI|nr:hypothetical protein GNI_066490 [Gregarina niphandrodes]EZG67688.1 hypothetical protein GNI_066490 [Gregarina niphandrodes]|eukprot:XP_011130160.1 hypothetical protein GNI_066490 [Gregarina niphandrodes]
MDDERAISIIASVINSGDTEIIGEFKRGVGELADAILHSEAYRRRLEVCNGIQNTSEVWHCDQWGSVLKMLSAGGTNAVQIGSSAVRPLSGSAGLSSTRPVPLAVAAVEIEKRPVAVKVHPNKSVDAAVSAKVTKFKAQSAKARADAEKTLAALVSASEMVSASTKGSAGGAAPAVPTAAQVVRASRIPVRTKTVADVLEAPKYPSGVPLPNITSTKTVATPNKDGAALSNNHQVLSKPERLPPRKVVSPQDTAALQAVTQAPVDAVIASEDVTTTEDVPAPAQKRISGKIERLLRWDKKLQYNPLLPSHAPVVERQTCVVVNNHLCHILSEAVTEKVPLSKNFVVRSVTTLAAKDPDGPVPRTMVLSSFALEWVKSTWLQKKVQNTATTEWRRSLNSTRTNLAETTPS